ncbi:MAG: hypothetical protein Aureis2KO_03630 [Aureisphaera sp.]
MASRLILLLLFAVTFFPLWGQDAMIDSLQKRLNEDLSQEDRVRVLTNIGVRYNNKQVYFDSAFYYTEKAFLLAKQYNLEKMQANTLFNLGIIHNSINDYSTAISYYEKSKEVIERLGLTGPLGNVLNNIGGCYFELFEYDTAIRYYKEALTIAEEQGDLNSVAIDYMNIGESLYKKGDLQGAKLNLEKAIEIISTGDFDPATVHLFYGRTLYALGDMELARMEGEKALQISEGEGDTRYIAESSELLAKIYVELDDFKSAHKNERKFRIYSDSLNTAKEINEIEKLRLNLELQENKEQLALVMQRTKYQNIIYILVSFVAIILVILVFRQRKIVKMTKEIHTIQKRLVGQELDKREWKRKNPNVSSFEAARKQDEEI